MIDLFSTAHANVSAIEHRLTTLKLALTSAEADLLDRFGDWIRNGGRTGINMRQTTLLLLITIDSYQNIYEWAKDQSHISGRSVDDILRQRLGSFFQKRITFDAAFDRGLEFRYGTLIVSGLGPTNYGNYCVVLKRDWVSTVKLAYLRADSLRTYMVSDTMIDVSAIERDAAPSSMAHILASLKHRRTLPVVPEHVWPSMLCSDSDFIEAIFVGQVTSADIEEVRISKSDYDFFFYFAFDDFRGKLDEADKALIEGFNAVIKLLSRKAIHLEVIDC
jgi:hypothetical protein